MATTGPELPDSWQINREDPAIPDLLALLNEHAACMLANSPPGSCHFLDLERLQGRDVEFWTVRKHGLLAGCGALKHLDPGYSEIKSMKTATPFLRRGVASCMLSHLINTAKSQGIARLSLETGASDYFVPARRMYENAGFTYCAPFGSYQPDPHSMFMTLEPGT
jgi:putative acetyltransferase